MGNAGDFLDRLAGPGGCLGLDDADDLGPAPLEGDGDLLGGETASPHGRSIRVTRAPLRWATSHMRAPKTPLTQTSIESPGSIRLTIAASMPADPVPLMAKVIRFWVCITLRIACWVASISSR